MWSIMWMPQACAGRVHPPCAGHVRTPAAGRLRELYVVYAPARACERQLCVRVSGWSVRRHRDWDVCRNVPGHLVCRCCSRSLRGSVLGWLWVRRESCLYGCLPRIQRGGCNWSLLHAVVWWWTV
jgi:hypothetical protein